MDIKTPDQLMRLITGVRLHYRNQARTDEYNYMVRARKAEQTVVESMVYTNKLNLIRRNEVCPLNWAFQEAVLFRGQPTNARILAESNRLKARLATPLPPPPLNDVHALSATLMQDLAMWAAQDRQNVEAFSQALKGGVDLDFPACEIWSHVMRLYPIMRDIVENKFKAV